MACGAAAAARHVWWDLYSPTEAVDALVANWSWGRSPADSASGSGATMSSICSPISLQQLAAAEAPPAG